MTTHVTGTREQWLKARLELLEAEKELTRRSDELARRRQELPWVRVDKEYRFETDEGSASLADLFRGRSQLLVYHFMFGPDYTAGCPSCSAIADGFDGFVVHLANHDVMLWAVSRAPLAKLQAYKRRMGWTFPWASSLGGDFNFDFNVSITEEQQRAGRRRIQLPARGGHADASATARGSLARARRRPGSRPRAGPTPATYTRERPGMSAFALEDGVVYHTYSTYARGLDGLWGMYQWLDRAPKGRNETGVLVAPPRRVRETLSRVVEDHRADRPEIMPPRPRYPSSAPRRWHQPAPPVYPRGKAAIPGASVLGRRRKRPRNLEETDARSPRRPPRDAHPSTTRRGVRPADRSGEDPALDGNRGAG